MIRRWWVLLAACGVGALSSASSGDDRSDKSAVDNAFNLRRRAIHMGDWFFLRRDGVGFGEELSALIKRLETDASARGLVSELERWLRGGDGDSALQLMVVARHAAARGEGGLFDRCDEASLGARWADLLCARAWLKEMTGDGGSAERDWKAFLAVFPADERRGRVALQLARQLIKRAAYPEARVALRQGLDASPDVLIWSELTYGMGSVQFGLGEFEEAFESFRNAAVGVDYPERAFFNAGLAAVRARNEEAFSDAIKCLETSVEGRERAGMLKAELMLDRASRGLMGSSELADFLAAGGGGLMRADLHAVLALLRQREGAATDDDLTAIDEKQLSSAGRRLILVLRLIRGDAGADVLEGLAPGDWESAGPVFMEQAAGIWGTAGELLRAERAYSSAAAQVADENGKQRLLLLAGAAAGASGEAAGMRRAMAHWDAVGDGGGQLALLARLHQGLLQMHLGNEDAALAVFEFVMKSRDSTGALRRMAESCVAQVAFRAWERSRSQEDAARALARIQSELRSAIAWGRADCRARHRVGQLLLSTGDVAGAVEEWKALLAGTPDGKSSVQWVESAGFALASILERRGDYRGAAESMHRVAALGGALATEAAERAADLRVRGFLPLR